MYKSSPVTHFIMPRDIIILECTEAKAEGKPTSRYVTTRNKKACVLPAAWKRLSTILS